MSTATINAARAAEANLVNQLTATAEALAAIANTTLDVALERVRAEAAALRDRVEAVRLAVAVELLGVVGCLDGLANDLDAGLTLAATALPAPTVKVGQSEPLPLAAPVQAEVPTVETAQIPVESTGNPIESAAVPHAEPAPIADKPTAEPTSSAWVLPLPSTAPTVEANGTSHSAHASTEPASRVDPLPSRPTPAPTGNGRSGKGAKATKGKRTAATAAV